MKYVFSLFLVLFGPGLIMAQTYTGRVVDARNGEPIPFATLQYGPYAGVITNEEGDYRFTVPEGTTSVDVSCMGYQACHLALDSLPGSGSRIALGEAVVALDGVFLSNRVPDAGEIMSRVRANLNRNYPGGFRGYKIFSRKTEYVNFDELSFAISGASEVSGSQVRETNEELDSLSRAITSSNTINFEDFLGDLYVGDGDSMKLQVARATSLLDAGKDFSVENIQQKAQNITLQYLDSSQTYKLKTGILKIEDSLDLREDTRQAGKAQEWQNSTLRDRARTLYQTNSFREGDLLRGTLNPRDYSFAYRGTSFLGEEVIYRIDFKPRRSKARYAGSLYVNGNDFAIVKATYAYAEGKRGRKVNLKWLLGIKYLENLESGMVLFHKNDRGSYDPQYIRHSQGSYFYVSRPLKFIENSRERNKVRLKFTLAGNTREKNELLFANGFPLDAEGYREVVPAEKVPFIRLDRYDATLWEGQEILQPLEEMRQFNALE